MDRESKWAFCCCGIVQGVRVIVSIEIVASLLLLTSIILSISSLTISDYLLITSLIIFLTTSLLVLIGLHKIDSRLLYPSLVSRALLVITVQACGITSVLSHDPRLLGTALPLVASVFALLTFGLLAIYTFYLVVRAILCLKEKKKLSERRSSFIEAAMMEEAAYSCSRRESDLP